MVLGSSTVVLCCQGVHACGTMLQDYLQLMELCHCLEQQLLTRLQQSMPMSNAVFHRAGTICCQKWYIH